MKESPSVFTFTGVLNADEQPNVNEQSNANEQIAQQLGISAEELCRPLELHELWQVCRPAESEAEKLHRECLYARLAVQARIRRERH
jgi:hypothetical protein